MSVFQCITKIVSGPGSLDELKSIQADRVFLVTDRYFSESGIAAEVAGRMDGAEVTIFDAVTPDPSAEQAAGGAAACRGWGPQVLIALGGGSVIDCAKGILTACEEPMTFVAIPTTSGSGSEMTSYAILTKDGVKHPLVDETLRPDVTILDDDLLRKLPASLIADTGMDLLTHCMEALVATNRSSITDALAVHGIRTVLRDLPRSYHGDASVRMELHEAASMGGLAFDHAGLGLCHAIAHGLGGAFHIPHGRLCAMILPHVMEYNASGVVGKYAELARLCGLSGPTDRLAMRSLQSELRRLRRELNLPEHLGQAGVTRDQWDSHREQLVAAALKDPCCGTNPVPVTKAGIEAVLKAVSP